MSPYTPLLRPDRYFATHEVNFFRVMTIVAVLLFAGPATVYGVGWLLATHIDGTVMVDNPDRPPTYICEGDFESTIYDEGDCDRPKEVERDVDRVLWAVIDDLVGPAFLAFPLSLLVTGLILHAGSWLAEGEGGAFPSFAVAAWGMLPSLVGIVVMFVVMFLWLDSYTILPGTNPGAALEPVMDQLREIRRATPIVTVLTAVWSGVIWRYGLEHHRGLTPTPARLVAGTTALLAALVGLLA